MGLKLKSLIHNKKGFEISFSWLFSIIAGMSIFLFFVWFAVQQTDLFGNLTAKVAVEELDIAFTGFKSNLVGSKLDFGKEIELEFKCDSSTLDEERMFINGIAGKKLKGNLVFAPSLMKSNEFKLFTASWNAPFRVTNFIFLNSNKDLLDLSDQFFGEIPDIFNDGSAGVLPKIIPGTLSGDSCSAQKEIYYQIDPDTGEAYGGICLGRTEPYPYYGDAFVYAAVFADEENFGCIHENALRKFGIMRELYIEKVKAIRIISSCSFEADRMESALNKLDITDSDTISDTIKEVKERNDALLREGCEGIY